MTTIMIGTDEGDWIKEDLTQDELNRRVATGELRRCTICDGEEQDGEPCQYDDGLPSYHNY